MESRTCRKIHGRGAQPTTLPEEWAVRIPEKDLFTKVWWRFVSRQSLASDKKRLTGERVVSESPNELGKAGTHQMESGMNLDCNISGQDLEVGRAF